MVREHATPQLSRELLVGSVVRESKGGMKERCDPVPLEEIKGVKQ